MPAESIVALAVILGMFAFFSGVLTWASHIAPPTFPQDRANRYEPSRSNRNDALPAGAH